jgi:hypothetical protein
VSLPADARGGARVARPQGPFQNRESPPIERRGLRASLLALVENGQVIHGDAHLGVVGAEAFLFDGEGPPVTLRSGVDTWRPQRSAGKLFVRWNPEREMIDSIRIRSGPR